MTQPNSSNTPKRDQPDTDSPKNGEPVFLVIGRLRHAHGVKGEIGMEVLTDFPERLKPGVRVYIGENHKPHLIIHLRPKNKLLLLTFAEYTDCDQVNTIRNELVYTDANQLPALPEDHYYHHQLIGITVKNETGEILGILEEIIETGANDVYLVRSESGSEVLLPAIEGVILDVNLEKREMVTHPPEWSS
jgi:16S rRNA processing protein RimM